MSRLFARRLWVIETRLTQEECVRRLKAKLRGMLESGWNAEKPLYGAVWRSGFALQITPGRGRSVNPYFVEGEFAPSTAGTTIRAWYRIRTSYRLFVTGLVSFFLYMFWRVSQVAAGPEVSVFVGSFLFLFALWMYARVGRMNRLAEFDRDLILGAVAEILDARIHGPADSTLDNAA